MRGNNEKCARFFSSSCVELKYILKFIMKDQWNIEIDSDIITTCYKVSSQFLNFIVIAHHKIRLIFVTIIILLILLLLLYYNNY